MTTMHDLARSLAAHPRWGWRAGMATTSELRVVRVDPDDGTPALFVGTHDVVWGTELPPDLADPATVGCLLAMLGDVIVTWDPRLEIMGLSVSHLDSTRTDFYEAPTLGEAAAKALLEVWG